MRSARMILLMMALASGASQAAEDYPAALVRLEAALVSDPDSLRYGNEYRQLVIQAKEYDRCLRFFEKLVADHPQSANAYLNYGFALVDKIPVAGSITQVILANNAIMQFTRSIEIKSSWLAYYTRGNSYLYWPRVFQRTHLGIADLEQAMRMQKAEKKHSYHVRTFIALGEGYWKMDQGEKARAVWQGGLDQFPENSMLKELLAKKGEALKALIEDQLDPGKRVSTDLRELWTEP